ncbi:9731_t:CDS:2, partial [Racocetra fulgida]
MASQNSDLNISDFFELSFGLSPIELDPNSFVTEELTYELFISLIEPSLCEPNPRGIFRKLFPYLVDNINRTISITKLANYVNDFNNENNHHNDPKGILQQLKKCTGRDFFIAFLDKVSIKSLPKFLNTVVYANIPIPIFLPNDMVHFEKGLRILDAMYDIIDTCKYHLFISVNQENSKMKPPFTKQLYQSYSNHRDDCLGICNPGSIDISFHAASKNHARPPLAISEIYYDKTNSNIFQNMVTELSKSAFYIVIHAFDDNFDGIEPNDEFKTIINDISIEKHSTCSRIISVLFWGLNEEDRIYNKRKQSVLDLLIKKFFHDQIRVEIINEEKKSLIFKEIKELSFQKLLNTSDFYLSANIFHNLFDKNYVAENSFSTLMEATTFNCRADIFKASYYSNEIETLKDQTRLKTLENSEAYITEYEIDSEIKKFQELQKSLCSSDPIPVLKAHLHELALKSDEINQNDQQNAQQNAQKNEIKHQIEDRDITIHDFWREFIILSQIKKKYSTALKSIYNIDNMTLNSEFLLDLFSQIIPSNKQLIVLSVIGPEGSGKSTLLNYLFQTSTTSTERRYVILTYYNLLYNMQQYINIYYVFVNILDFEGICSEVEKFTSRRTDFDKKITLLAILCSQIVILNTKSLTQDISDILEVSFYHMDTLIKRNFKPKINFVLRDMIDAISVQQTAFNDIREGLKKMFTEIPGCAYSMEGLMIIEEKNIYSLENIFSCNLDEFYPNSKPNSHSNGEKIYYPVETFPSKVSKLRVELLTSALTSNENELHDYKNIDVRINDESYLKPYKEEILNLIDEIESDQWSEDDDAKFETALTKVTDTLCEQTISNFLANLSDEYDHMLIEEGKTYITSTFISEKRKLQAIYMIKRRTLKDSWLIKSAKIKINENLKQVIDEKTLGKVKKNLSECDHYFNSEWEYIEADKKAFTYSMLSETKILEEQVVTCFNKAITDGVSMVSSEDESKKQFDRIFWSKLEKPSILVRTKFLKNSEFLSSFKFKFIVEQNSAGIAGYINNVKRGILKQAAIRTIKTSIKKTCKQISNEIQNNNMLAIEFNQALEWIQRLCDNIFVTLQKELNSSQNNFIVKIDDFKPMEQYLRLKVFKRLDANTKKWKDTQQKELDEYRKNLWKFFVDLKSETYYEYLSCGFLEHIFQSFEKQLYNPYNIVSELMDKHFNNDNYKITNIAYERSFGSHNVENSRSYIENPIKFMKKLFNEEIEIIKNMKIDEKIEEIEMNIVNTMQSELKEIISRCKQHYSSRPTYESSYISPNIEQILRLSKGTLLETLIKEKPQGSDNIIKCVVKYPSRFLICLEEMVDIMIPEFKNKWKDKIKNHKHDSDIPHKASIHLMVSFTGVKNSLNEASLNICTDPIYQNDICEEFNGHSFGAFIQTNYPKWWPIDQTNINEDQLKQIRAIWVQLKSELC